MANHILEISKLSQDKKEWLANAICGMVCSDGIIDEVELEFLKKALGFIGEKETVMSMVEIVKQKKIPPMTSLKTVSRDEAFKIFLFLGKLSLSDARLTVDEIDFLRQVGAKLGFSKLVCEKLNHIMMQARNIIRENKEENFEMNKEWLDQVAELEKLAKEETPSWAA